MTKQPSKKSKSRLERVSARVTHGRIKEISQSSLPQKSRRIKLPRNYRIITENVYVLYRRYGVFVYAGVLGLLLGLTVVSGIQVSKALQSKEQIKKETAKVKADIAFWQDVTKKYDGYRDAYFQLALLEYRLQNFEKSKEYLQKALELDPNFVQGRKLEKILD